MTPYRRTESHERVNSYLIRISAFPMKMRPFPKTKVIPKQCDRLPRKCYSIFYSRGKPSNPLTLLSQVQVPVHRHDRGSSREKTSAWKSPSENPKNLKKKPGGQTSQFATHNIRHASTDVVATPRRQTRCAYFSILIRLSLYLRYRFIRRCLRSLTSRLFGRIRFSGGLGCVPRCVADHRNRDSLTMK